MNIWPNIVCRHQPNQLFIMKVCGVCVFMCIKIPILIISWHLIKWVLNCLFRKKYNSIHILHILPCANVLSIFEFRYCKFINYLLIRQFRIVCSCTLFTVSGYILIHKSLTHIFSSSFTFNIKLLHYTSRWIRSNCFLFIRITVIGYESFFYFSCFLLSCIQNSYPFTKIVQLFPLFYLLKILAVFYSW